MKDRFSSSRLAIIRLKDEVFSAVTRPTGVSGRMEGNIYFKPYEGTVPVMLHGLPIMDDYLDHAQKLERASSLDPGSVPGSLPTC